MQQQALVPEGFSRVGAAAHLAGVSVPTVWRWAQQGRFPAPVRIAPQVTAWRNADLLNWAADPVAWASRSQQGASA